MGVAQDIIRSYRAPRGVLRHRLGPQENEGAALVTLMLACGLIFVAGWPRLSRIAFETGQELQMLLGAALLSWLFMMPLFFYILALIVNIIQRILRFKTTGYETRMALFWGLLAAAPMWLFWGLSVGFLSNPVAVSFIGALSLAVLLYFWIAGLIEVSKR